MSLGICYLMCLVTLEKLKFYIPVIYSFRLLNLNFICLFLFQEKRHWRRYIYLWINYALYEELEAEDVERTRDVYKACLDIIPHKNFTFAKIWLLFAHFEVRQKNLQGTRRILVWNYLPCNSLSLVIQCLNKGKEIPGLEVDMISQLEFPIPRGHFLNFILHSGHCYWEMSKEQALQRIHRVGATVTRVWEM